MAWTYLTHLLHSSGRGYARVAQAELHNGNDGVLIATLCYLQLVNARLNRLGVKADGGWELQAKVRRGGAGLVQLKER